MHEPGDHGDAVLLQAGHLAVVPRRRLDAGRLVPLPKQWVADGAHAKPGDAGDIGGAPPLMARFAHLVAPRVAHTNHAALKAAP